MSVREDPRWRPLRQKARWRIAVRKHLGALAFGCAIHSSIAASQPTTLEWDAEDTCHYVATFDGKEFDEKRLHNTIGLVFGETQWLSNLWNFPDHLNDLRIVPRRNPNYTLWIDEYKRGCSASVDAISRVELLDIPDLAEYRLESIEYLQRTCAFNTIEARAKAGDTVALREYAPAAKPCSRYIDILESGKDIRPFWNDLWMAQCRNNGNPAACLARARETADGPDGTERMRLDIIQYGWRNCAVAATPPFHTKVSDDELREELARLLHVKKSDCHPESHD
jgi:hypothetical protein